MRLQQLKTLKIKLQNKYIKPLMLSKYGYPVRKIFPVFKPWCRIFPDTIPILSNGKVTTCCVDSFGRNSFGSIYEHTIQEIWDNRIARILNGDLYDFPVCRECIGSPQADVISRKNEYVKWRNAVSGYPKELSLEITSECIYDCCDVGSICSARGERGTKLDLDTAFENIKMFLPRIENMNLYVFGEPLLHKGFCDFIKKCRGESGNFKMLLSTNGILMNEKISRSLIEAQVTEVVISIHAGPGTENMLRYSKRGANYEKVLSNISQLVSLRSKYSGKVPKISIKSILFNWNDTDELMDRLRMDSKMVGADRVYWVLDGGHGSFPRSSDRYVLGSRDLAILKKRGEFSETVST